MEEVRITYILIHLSSIHTIITGYKIADPDRNCFLLNHSPAAPADASEPHIFHSVIMASGMEGSCPLGTPHLALSYCSHRGLSQRTQALQGMEQLQGSRLVTSTLWTRTRS